MRRLTHVLVLAAFMFSCGGHWYVLQAVAWVNMIHQYAQFVPLTKAVSMTPSGQYPCAICKAIAEKKAAERTQICSIEKHEKKLFPLVLATMVRSWGSPLTYPVLSVRLESRTETPPVPPPRSVLG